MPFTTLSYIAFFAVVFFAYYAIPKRFQWWLLLAASIFFYGFSSPYYLFFLLATIVVTYLGAVGMDRSLRIQKDYIKSRGKEWSREEKKTYKSGMERKRRWMAIGVIVGLIGMLGTFKYAQFLVDNVVWLGGLIGWHPISPALNFILPIGLSFYVFQSLGYCIDVYREEMPAERNFFRHALYVSFFPQIMQGPIGNYGRLAPQLFSPKSFDYQQSVFGLQRVVWGFFKKFMIANLIADRINPCWTHVSDYPGLICWAAILFLYAIQLYADFSGYMDIACGCSQMLGIKLDENFESPYFTKSIAEFWRKWHITLGAWFKDYVFYPILRSEWNTNIRKRFASSKYLSNTASTVVGLLIIWMAIGLWHGADWSYVVYGLYHGFFVILAVVLSPVYDRLHALAPRFFGSRAYAAFQILRTFVIVTIGYAIFKPANLGNTVELIQQCLTGNESAGIYKLQYTLHHSFIKVFVWMALLMLVDAVHCYKPVGYIREKVSNLPLLVRWGGYLAVLWAIIFFGLYGSGFDQFEYFKF